MEDGGPSLTAKEKRQEQLKRWENSATDLESKVLNNVKPRVKFDDGAVFLAACSSGDLKEVGVLLNNGADINFANIDGLTALHQACIDGNLDVVEYLIERGIDIDQEDNEGWTPLHAASSCGYMDIARYLVEHEANVVAVNSEGEVPLDIAEEDEMVEYLQQEVDKRDLDIDEARNREREMMTIDAKQHLNAVQNGENPTIYMHPKSGATALHVAAAKGYIDVIRILLQAGMAPNARDTDGWTPLHAASHWSQQEAAKLLADRNADFNIRSKLGQTPFDVADEEMLDYLEVLQEQQKENNAQMKETPVIGNPPSPVTYEKPSQPQQDSFDPLLSRSNNPNSHSFGLSIQAHPNGTEKSRETSSHFKLSHHADEVSSSSDDDEDSTSSSSEVASSKGGSKAFKKPKQIENDIDHRRPPLGLARVGSSDTVNLRNRDNQDSRSKLTQSASSGNVSSIASRRTTRPASLHLSSSAAHKDIRPPVMSAHEIGSRPTAAAQPIVDSKTTNGPGPTPGTPTERNPAIKEGAPGTWRSGLRKTGSYDEKTKPFQRSAATPARPTDADKTQENKRTARVAPILDARAMSKPGGKESDSTSDKQGYQRSGSYRRPAADAAPSSSSSSHAPSTYRRSISYKKAVGRTTSADMADTSSMLNRGGLSSADDENTSSSVTSSATRDLSDSQSAAATTEENKQDRRRSHLQPVRDEEAEAQRRARSRRERQARRSTQGVTLDVVEEAKRQIESKMHESKLSSQADNSSSSEQARLPHNDSIPVNLHRRHKDLHSSTGSTGSSAASQARTVTLPSGYIPSADRVKTTASSGPFVAGNVPSITVNDDRVDKNDGESLDDGDDDKNATPGEQSPSAKKSAAHQRRRQRKERRSTGLPGLRVTDHVATDGFRQTADSCDDEVKNLIPSSDTTYDLAWLRQLGRVTRNVKELNPRRSRGSMRKVAFRERRQSVYQNDLHPIELRRRHFESMRLASPKNSSLLFDDAVMEEQEGFVPIDSAGLTPFDRSRLCATRRHSHCGASPSVASPSLHALKRPKLTQGANAKDVPCQRPVVYSSLVRMVEHPDALKTSAADFLAKYVNKAVTTVETSAPERSNFADESQYAKGEPVVHVLRAACEGETSSATSSLPETDEIETVPTRYNSSDQEDTIELEKETSSRICCLHATLCSSTAQEYQENERMSFITECSNRTVPDTDCNINADAKFSADLEKVKRKLDFSDTQQNHTDDEEVTKNDVEAVDGKTDRFASKSRYDTSSLPDRHTRHRSGTSSDADMSSRLAASTTNASEDRQSSEKGYKKLFEEQRSENDNLRDKLSEARKNIAELEAKLEREEERRRAAENEHREKRVLERKLAEKEKELINTSELAALQAKNAELKQENAALTRLVNKLGLPEENKSSTESSSLVHTSANSAVKFSVGADAQESKTGRRRLPAVDREPELSKIGNDTSAKSESAESERAISEKARSSSDALEDPDRQPSLTDTYKYSSSKYSSSSRSYRDTTAPSKYSSKLDRPLGSSADKTSSYRSDYSSSRYGRSDHGEYKSERPYSTTSSSSFKERRNKPSSNITSSISSPSLSGYHTIPTPSARNRILNSTTSGRSALSTSDHHRSSPVQSPRLHERRDLSSYRSSRNIDSGSALSRPRSTVTFPSSASSKRVGDLMNSYRSTLKQ